MELAAMRMVSVTRCAVASQRGETLTLEGMKDVDASRCAVHVCVCTNDQSTITGGCSQVGGGELFAKLKHQVLRDGLAGSHWITRTGCLGFCNTVGTTVVIHRRDAPAEWRTEVTEADYGALWARIAGSSS